MAKLKLKFESNQEHQLAAIRSIVDLFDGMEKVEQAFQLVGDETIANMPEFATLEENWLHSNLNFVREQNKLPPTMSLETDDGPMLEEITLDTWHYPNFTVEMETGTGKTYVYLRSIFELQKEYGFRKYIIVVPSVAIYAGVIKTIEITREHFRSLYGNEVVHLTRYDGQQVGRLRNFASSSFLEVMVITLDSFNKASNVIYKPSEKLPGEKLPIHFIQETRPILILDEVQNYTSTKAKQALRTLKPLFSIGYSATPPREKPNLVYRLGPVDAFRQNLVKKIEVLGVNESNYNNPQLQLALESIGSGYTPTAKANVLVYQNGTYQNKTIELKKGDDLFAKTKNEAHRGLVVEEINRGTGEVTFTNQEVLSFKEKESRSKNEIFKTQIEETIKFHLRKQDELRSKGIKVLSLFFIDRVAKYQNDDGFIKKTFEESFNKIKATSGQFSKLEASQVHRGYFASKKNKKGEVEYFDTNVNEDKKTKEEKELEKEAYKLIMEQKERLLSFEEKVCFIFAHSALKEGWDSPNVFQICTLNDTVSEPKKRQEIGRGLRLCVNQDGERITDEGVNILTVIANESYESYVSNLQKQYAESGDMDMPPPSKAKPYTAKRNNKLFKSQEFQEFWSRLCQKTAYRINVDSDKVVEQSIQRLNAIDYPEPKITITRGRFIITEFKLELLEVKVGFARIQISITNTVGGSNITTNNFKVGSDLQRISKDDRLKGFKIVDIVGKGDEAEVHFGDRGLLTRENPIVFHSERGQQTDPRTIIESEQQYPIGNIISRAANETKLTRPTILRIFVGMRPEKKEQILKNPEGFSDIFIREVKNVLANHIADNIEYELTSGLEDLDMESCFPQTKHFPQKELIEGTANSLYNVVQIDSEVESRFVKNRLQKDDEDNKLFVYFKFPSSFKISMPKIIQNYNPDWGIIRVNEEGKGFVQLVRETKGTVYLDRLRFPNESRKILCAKKHFEKIGIDYRSVDDKVLNWWRKED